MTTRRPLSDETVDAVLTGRSVPLDAADVAVFTTALRAAGTRPVEPSAALAAVLAGGVVTGIDDGRAAAPARPTRRRRARMAAQQVLAAVAAKLAGLGAAAKTAAVATVAVASVGAAGAGGALPEPAPDRVGKIIENVTPFEAPGSGDDSDQGKPAGENERNDFGQSVSEDARDGGVDGREVSERAKQNGNRPSDAGRPSGVGRPSGTPARSGKPAARPTGSARPASSAKPTDLPTPSDKPTGRPTGTPGAGKPAAPGRP